MIASRGARWLSLLAVLLAMGERSALAGDSAAAAEALFAEGKRLEQGGNYGAACPRFEESQKLDPATGTLYHLADCYTHTGRPASAWAAFVEVAAAAKAAGQQARYDDAKKRAEALERDLPKLVIRVDDPGVADLVVKRGEVVVGPPQWGTPLPVDPGEVTVEASAPGRKTWRGTVTVKAGSPAELHVPVLEQLPAAPAAAPPPIEAPPVSETNRQPSSFGAQRTAAVVAGALGVAGLGFGSVFGLVSSSRKHDADAHCDAANTCDDQGLTLRHDAISAGNLSTIGFVAGGVLAAAGLVLWLTAPSRPSRAALLPRGSRLTFAMELP